MGKKAIPQKMEVFANRQAPPFLSAKPCCSLIQAARSPVLPAAPNSPLMLGGPEK
jgi:hypothetical protein